MEKYIYDTILPTHPVTACQDGAVAGCDRDIQAGQIWRRFSEDGIVSVHPH